MGLASLIYVCFIPSPVRVGTLHFGGSWGPIGLHFSNSNSKEIYDFLLKNIVYKNGSVIPSRREKRSQNVKWSLVWENLQSLKGLTPEEKCFTWKVSQDMLPVGSRIHRKNAERRCMSVLENGQNCIENENLEHRFQKCEKVRGVYNKMVEILETFLGQEVVFYRLIHFAINHRNKKNWLSPFGLQ